MTMVITAILLKARYNLGQIAGVVILITGVIVTLIPDMVDDNVSNHTTKRRKKEEGRRKKEEGRRKKEEGEEEETAIINYYLLSRGIAISYGVLCTSSPVFRLQYPSL